MNKKYVVVSLDDAKTRKIADVISNASCKKILDYLAETNEASESDISSAINVPLNTVDYNIKKLVQAGLVEKAKKFFWSVKGKKIDMYKVSNKSILISPRSKVVSGIKSILPAAIISGLFAILLKYLTAAKTFATKPISRELYEEVATTVATGEPAASKAIPECINGFIDYAPWACPTWSWFLAGAGFALLVFLVINLVRRRFR